MKKIHLFMLFILPMMAIAQPPGPPPGAPPPPSGPGMPKMSRKMMAEHQNRLQALSIAHLTKVLDLTTAEAEKFWPVYNKYNEEVRKAMRDSTKQDVLEKQQEVLNIRKKYQKDFQKILSAERAQKIYKAEMEFREMVRKELDERRRMMDEKRAEMEGKRKKMEQKRKEFREKAPNLPPTE